MNEFEQGPVANSEMTILPIRLELPTDPPVELNDETRILVEVVTRSGRAAAVALRLRLDTVEVWFRDHCCGVFDRDEMRSWLAGGQRQLSADEVTLSLDPRSSGERVAISLDDVIAWTISPAELATVRQRV